MNFTIKKASKKIETFQIILQTSRGQFVPVKKTMNVWKQRRKYAVDMGELLHKEHYFINAISSNKSIAYIFDDVMSKYINLFI